VSKGRRNDKRIARRVRHDIELRLRRRDNKFTKALLDAVARTPLSDAQVAQVRAALLEERTISWPQDVVWTFESCPHSWHSDVLHRGPAVEQCPQCHGRWTRPDLVTVGSAVETHVDCE
jgi:hypothetical protein